MLHQAVLRHEPHQNLSVQQIHILFIRAGCCYNKLVTLVLVSTFYNVTIYLISHTVHRRNEVQQINCRTLLQTDFRTISNFLFSQITCQKLLFIPIYHLIKFRR